MSPSLDNLDRDAVEQYRLLLDGIADYAIFLLDADGRIRHWSTSAQKMFHYRAEEVLQRHMSCLYPSADQECDKVRQELQLAAVHGRFEDVGWRIRRDGTRLWADSIICPVRSEEGQIRGFSLIVRDITERKKAEQILREKEEELAQARKMEAIGRLAGGVAHDFNNFITGIIGLSDEVRLSLDETDARRDDLEEVIKTAERARALTQELLAFGRRQTSVPQVLNLNAILEEKVKTLSRLMGADIEMQTRLDSRVGNILIDPTQLHQILINIIMNARDAMPGGGVITLQTESVHIDQANGSDGLAGPYVALSISDTGIGIDPNTLPHVFEPFFTTKSQGKGTGLGLATVYGIVKQNHGSIAVQSQKGKGTTFRILFPEVDKPARMEAPLSRRKASSGSETILVVEDEDVVRRVTIRTLEKCGYHVIAAASAEEALQRAQDPRVRIHLLITDVIMPGMNGCQLAELFCVQHPETAVLYMSGYPKDVFHQRGLMVDDISFLEKPFTGESLSNKVREVLEHHRAAI